jgi:hypothetical protein
LLVPLALTSTSGMIRRLGKRWQQLHRLVYVAALAGVIHFYWLVKADIRRPVQYGTVLFLLLGYRLLVKWLPAFRSARSCKSAAYNAAENGPLGSVRELQRKRAETVFSEDLFQRVPRLFKARSLDAGYGVFNGDDKAQRDVDEVERGAGARRGRR